MTLDHGSFYGKFSPTSPPNHKTDWQIDWFIILFNYILVSPETINKPGSDMKSLTDEMLHGHR